MYLVLRALWRTARPLAMAPRKAWRLAVRKRKGLRCRVAPGAVIYPEARLFNHRDRDSIRIGANSHVLCRFETLGHGGSISVGRDCFIGEHSYIWSASSIKIGDRVLISHGVNIHDNISHSLSAADRHAHFLAIFSEGHPKHLENVTTLPIIIEDDAWIGFGATILKGVTIGRGAVVGAQSVVTKDVAPFTIVVGNPARVVGHSHA